MDKKGHKMNKKGLKIYEKDKKIELKDQIHILFGEIFLSRIGGPPPWTENHFAKKNTK